MKIKPEAWLILFVLTLIWGSSFILMKKGLDSFTPMQVGSLRILSAGLFMLPVAIKHFRKVSRETILYSILFGLLNAGIPNFLFPLAETKVNTSTAGILNGLTPIFTLIVGISFFRVSFNIFKLTGVVIGFVGAALLIFFSQGFTRIAYLQDSQLGFSFLIVLATCMYGFAGNIMKRHLDKVSGPVIASIAYCTLSVFTAMHLAFSDFAYRVISYPKALESLGYVAMLGIFCSAIGVILISRLMKQSSALFGSFVTYLIPFVAILWGIAANEKIGAVPFISLAVILIAIYISGLKPTNFRILKQLWPAGVRK